LELIEQHQPGSRKRLNELWTAYSRQSLFLWRINALASLVSTEDVKKLLAAAIQRSTGNEPGELSAEWIKVDDGAGAAAAPIEDDDEESSEDSPEISPPRVVKVRFANESIDAIVRVSRYTHFIFEDVEKRQAITQDINISVDLSKERARLAKVYGAQLHSKKAVRTLTEWLFQSELPQRNPALAQYIAPFRFQESDVIRMATRLGLDFVGMSGADAKDSIGRVAYDGKMAGFKWQPLDTNDDRIKSQEDIPQDLRAYNWDFHHAIDDFVEAGRVAFILDSRHSHISFLVRMSQASMQNVVEELYSSVE